jgi:phosphoenolpyruvate carboxylase
MLLGAVLREQAGVPLYQKVEDLRQSAIRHREAQAAGRLKEAIKAINRSSLLVYSCIARAL